MHIEKDREMEDTRIIKLAKLYSEGENVDIELQDLFVNIMNISNLDNIYVKRALGIMYLYGQGTKKDYLQAYTWLSEAALQGDAYSQNILGVMYKNGYGIAQNEKSALKWYWEAAKNGNSKAMINLGNYYSERDEYSTALEWYEKALKFGEGEAAFEIGCCYIGGNGVEENEDEARYYFNKSAENGFEYGVMFKTLYEENIEKADKYFKMAEIIEESKYIDDIQRKAMMFYKKAAEYGSIEAKAYVGSMYLHGDGCVEVNYNEAIKLLKEATRGGNARAANALGYMYANGYGVRVNDRKAHELFKKSAEKGDAEAMNNLAISYEEGIGVTPNQKRALEWYKKAAENGEKKGIDSIKRIEKNTSIIEHASKKIRNDRTMPFIFSIFLGIGLVIWFWSAVGDKNIYHVYRAVIVYLCGIIIPYFCCIVYGARVSAKAMWNRIIMLGVYILEIAGFSIVYYLIREKATNIAIWNGVFQEDIFVIFVTFLVGMIVLNYRNFMCAKQVNNPIGLILLSFFTIYVYSILVYTILIEALIGMLAIAIVILLIFLVIYGIGWYFCLW